MNQEIRQVLAEIAVMATNNRLYSDADSIVDYLETEDGNQESALFIRSLGLVRQHRFQDALDLIEGTVQEKDSPKLIALAILCCIELKLSSKAEEYLSKAELAGDDAVLGFCNATREVIRSGE